MAMYFGGARLDADVGREDLPRAYSRETQDPGDDDQETFPPPDKPGGERYFVNAATGDRERFHHWHRALTRPIWMPKLPRLATPTGGTMASRRTKRRLTGAFAGRAHSGEMIDQ